jgi:hypothetical protein
MLCNTLATRLSWVSITPLGVPVVPLEKGIVIIEAGSIPLKLSIKVLSTPPSLPPPGPGLPLPSEPTGCRRDVSGVVPAQFSNDITGIPSCAATTCATPMHMG